MLSTPSEAVLVNWDDYVELPDREEVNDYRNMEDFCYAQEDDKLRNILCHAIDGKGAFRRFRDAVSRHGIQEEWDAYKYEVLCKATERNTNYYWSVVEDIYLTKL